MGRAAVSGCHGPHLQKRNGIYHLRLRVPGELRLRMTVGEVRRSLHTYSITQARLLAAIYIPRVKKVFEMVNSKELSREDTTALVRACFDDLKSTLDSGYAPTSRDPVLEIAEQAGLASEHIQQLEVEVNSRAFSPSIKIMAARLCKAQGLSFDALACNRQLDLLEGISRACIEQQKFFLFRLHDRFSEYRPADALFRRGDNCTGASISQPAEGSSVGPHVGEALSAYLLQGAKKWTPKTLAGRRRQLEYLKEYFGAETALAAVSPHDVRGYRDGIKRLRSNHHRTEAQTFAQRQTVNENHRISPKTASLLFETCKAFFRWATEDEGYLATNPAQNVRIESPKKAAKAGKSRRSFEEAELRHLFTQPLFTGCLSTKRRFESGKLIIRDDYFWLPILGYYTGARLGELIQLHLGDINLTAPVPYVEITDAGGGEQGSSNAKHVKSAAGIRKVPLHPDLLQLGFVDFVSLRQKGRKGTDRLFHRIPYGSDGQASTVFSKWFARFLDKAGLIDPALVFHSFRHNAEDAFRDALQPQYVIDRIIGHSDGATSAAYGNGVAIETAHKAVLAMKLHLRIPELWKEC